MVMHITANGIRINYRVDGPEGAPWLVFSNSLATNFTMWDDQAARLSTSFRILRYDQRGHGGTEATEGPYDFPLLADDVVALMDALSVERVRYVGISMGGITGLTLGMRHPTRVDRLVVCDCTAASTPAGAQQWQERIALASADGMASLVDGMIDRWFPAHFVAANPSVVGRVRQMIRDTPVRGFIGGAGALANFNLQSGLGSIIQPTLFVCGAEDRALEGIRGLHASVAGSALVELDGAGHLCNLEKPEAFSSAVHEFLRAAG